METLTGLASRVGGLPCQGRPQWGELLLLMGPPHPHVRVNLPPSLVVVLVVHTHP